MIVSNELLHLAAKIAVRLWPPLVAKRRVDAIAAALRPLDIDEAGAVLSRLRGGTCLTRSLAIAARLPGSEVVIGATRASAIDAHAWVEVAGRPIGTPESKIELARLK